MTSQHKSPFVVRQVHEWNFPEAEIGCEIDEKQLEVRRHSFLIRLPVVLSLSFALTIAFLFATAFAQMPENGIPEKAPINRDQKLWTSQRNACIELGKEIAKYRAMTPAQLAKLPKLSKPQGRELWGQMEDCSRMAPPHPDSSRRINPPQDASLPNV
jgi:hypothetical protein